MYINESANYTLDEQVIEGRTIYFRSGSVFGNIPTKLYTLIENDLSKVLVYCIDDKIMPNYGSKYSAMNLTEAPYMDDESANRIRNILLNSYPALTVKEVITKSKIDNLKQDDIIAATQLAAWFYANGSEYEWDFGNHPDMITAKQLYDWYRTLPAVPATDTVAHMEIKTKQEGPNVDMAFKADRENYDGTEIVPTYTFDSKVLVEERGKDSEGYYHVLAVDPPSGISFTANAEQNMDRDGYMFLCIEGSKASQTFAAVYSGKFKLSLSTTLSFGKLRINKTNDNGDPLEGAVFNVFSGGNLKAVPVFENLISDSQGLFLIPKVLTGFYKVVEKRPPNGYIPLDFPQSASVQEDKIYDVSFTNKLVPPSELGAIKINKLNDLGKPLAGAVFNVYYADDTAVIPSYENVISDKNGQINIPNVAPAKYTIVEIQPPAGYISQEMKKEIDVIASQTAEVSFTNIAEAPIDVGTLVIKKTDVKGKPLQNAIFSVYFGSVIKGEPAYSNLVTDKNGLVTIKNVPIGEYAVVEDKPPTGYEPIENSKLVDVKSNDTAQIIFINALRTSSPSRQLSINNIIQSVALEQAALAHILNAEGEKIQKMVATENASKGTLIKVNDSVNSMVKSIASLELVLQGKLSLFEECLCSPKRDVGEKYLSSKTKVKVKKIKD